MRQHGQLGAQMLQARATLHQARALVQPGADELRKRKLEAQVEKAAPGPPISCGRYMYVNVML